MFDSLSTRLQDVFKTLRGQGRLTRRPGRGRAARDSARAARGRRQFQGRQGVHRPRPRPRDGAGGAAKPVAVAAGRQDRPRRDGGALRRRRRGPAADEQAAARHPAARAAGRRQDDDGGQAGEVAGEAGTPSAAGLDRRQASGGDRAAERRRAESGLRVHDPAGQMDPVARAKGAVAEAREPGLRRRHRRHRGPAAHRRRADERARGDSRASRTRRIGCSSPTR